MLILALLGPEPFFEVEGQDFLFLLIFPFALFFIAGKNIINDTPSSLSASVAVSYTHLDVYKRQI